MKNIAGDLQRAGRISLHGRRGRTREKKEGKKEKVEDPINGG